MPMTVKVLLEGLLRLSEAGTTSEENVKTLAAWPKTPPPDAEQQHKQSAQGLDFIWFRAESQFHGFSSLTKASNRSAASRWHSSTTTVCQ